MVEEIHVSIRRLPGAEDLPLPVYMTEQAAGMDLCAAVETDTEIPPGAWKLIPTGLAIALPDGFEAEVRPRSGLALKYGVTLVNSPGTIDADYRGEIMLVVINHGRKPFTVKRRDRLAQIVVHRVCRVIWDSGFEGASTARGKGGFGHTD